MRCISHVSRLLLVCAALAVTGCKTTTETNGGAVSGTSSAGGSGLRGDSLTLQPALAPAPALSQSRPVVIRTANSAANASKAVIPGRGGRDAFVLLSGGGTPLSNNYSQYLQARAIAAFFERECPPDATWVFFGAGNREGVPPVLADARREVKRDGRLVESWLPGVLKNNRPATRDSFLRALRDEILPSVRDGGTLYLFIGDHGELTGKGENRESAITLWQMKRGRRRGTWTTDESEILGVAELRKVLMAGLGRGRVVFGMTQCHGGGFHELGVAHDMTPPREWFLAAPPVWATGASAGVRLPIAGFTATDAASVAAGCDADPDPDRWAGYERFLPESLLGLDLMSGYAKGRPTLSFAEAHEAATLIDQTIDKPRATSEHYLEAWARMIETQLAGSAGLASRTREAIEVYERAVDRGNVSTADPALQERAAQFARFTQRLAEQVPAAASLLHTGTRQQLEAAVRERGGRGGPARGGRRGQVTDLRRAWTDTLRPAWKAAVLGGRVPGISGAVLEFEERLLKLEDGGRDFLLPRGNDETPFLNELYWNSTYAEPASFDAAKAETVTRWAAERRERIVAWGKASADALVRAAAEKIGPGPTLSAEAPRPLSRRTAAERVLFYRRVLAAWEFLVNLQAESALTELRTLIELERTPLRPGT